MCSRWSTDLAHRIDQFLEDVLRTLEEILFGSSAKFGYEDHGALYGIPVSRRRNLLRRGCHQTAYRHLRSSLGVPKL
jgi:hypothetical protein